MFYLTGPWGLCYKQYFGNLPQYQHLCKCHSKLLLYLSLPPWDNVIMLFTKVIYYHPAVNTALSQSRQGYNTFYRGNLLSFCFIHLRYRDVISPSFLALATLGGRTQIGPFLFMSYRPRWPRQVQYWLSRANVTNSLPNKLCQCKWWITMYPSKKGRGPICVPPPKVAKASKEGDNASQYRIMILH